MWGVGNCGTMIGGFAQIVFKLVLMSVLRWIIICFLFLFLLRVITIWIQVLKNVWRCDIPSKAQVLTW